MPPMRVLIADDHRLFRQGLISLMHTRPELVQVIGEAETGREAIAQAAELNPDLILMDIKMPDVNGIQATEAIRQKNPNTQVVMLTASELDDHVIEAVRAGAAGYMLKNLDASELFELIDGVSRGDAAISRSMASRLLKSIANGHTTGNSLSESLTERETEVLRLVARGASNVDIADQLCISVNTVKTHLQHILGKLNLENRTQAATYAVRNGIIAATQSASSQPISKG